MMELDHPSFSLKNGLPLRLCFHGIIMFYSLRKAPLTWLLIWLSLNLGFPWGWDLRDLPSQIYIEASFWRTPALSHSLVPFTLKPTAKEAEMSLPLYHTASGRLFLFEIWGPQRPNSFCFPFQTSKSPVVEGSSKLRSRSCNSQGARYVFPDLFFLKPHSSHCG